MKYDVYNIINGINESIEVDVKIDIPKEDLEKAKIINLKDSIFTGEISKANDEELNINGILKGIMYLNDDITLEPVEYKFEVKIDENFNEFSMHNENNLQIIQNKLDILDFLWQNIVLEVPTKVVSEKNQNLHLEGDGWKLITNEEIDRT